MNTHAKIWRKLGLIFRVERNADWMQTHSAVPFAERLLEDVFRVYFTTRDGANRSHIGYVDLDLVPPFRIIGVSPKPVLAPGPLGGFDDSGAMGSWMTEADGKRHLYYQGWNLGQTVPFRNAIGLATEQQPGVFQRHCPGPILDRSMFEPHFCGTPCVIADDDRWRMWYLSCTEWLIENGTPKHKYHIKYAESLDGIEWKRRGEVAIDFKDSEEYAISRPSVMKDPDRWRMWYSYRGDRYRIGYAESSDGVSWARLDGTAGIDASPSGWDSEMIEYPFVFDHRGSRYMLYNGNDYGRSGFGLAVLE